MALGGGRFTAQNRGLPGTYINFVSATAATATLSDRGIAAIALPLPWGPVGEMITVTGEEFVRRSRELFGRSYTHPDLAALRDLFAGAHTAHLYRLGAGSTRASSMLGRAKYAGSLGNLITIVVREEGNRFGIETQFEGVVIDYQIVATRAELVDNDFVEFARTGADFMLIPPVPFTGGADAEPTVADFEAFLEASENYAFHTMGCVSADNSVKEMFARHTMRMREEVGVKFQCVMHRYAEADHEGVISVENTAAEDDTALVYWVTGASAGCPVNRSLTNRRYRGEFTVEANYTQRELEERLADGQFLFYRLSGEVRVVEDMNTLTTVTADKSLDFALNQTIRVLDTVATDIAALFSERYLGIVPNDNAGRFSLWGDIVAHHRQLETLRAIETFNPQDITVEPGESKRSVVVTNRIMPVSAMSQLYMTVVVQ